LAALRGTEKGRLEGKEEGDLGTYEYTVGLVKLFEKRVEGAGL